MIVDPGPIVICLNMAEGNMIIPWSRTWSDIISKTMIYTDKDNQLLKEKHEETLKKLEADPQATEEEKDRIWKAIVEIGRGNG